MKSDASRSTGLFLIVMTRVGDNPLTAINVARDCGIIRPSETLINARVKLESNLVNEVEASENSVHPADHSEEAEHDKGTPVAYKLLFDTEDGSEFDDSFLEQIVCTGMLIVSDVMLYTHAMLYTTEYGTILNPFVKVILFSI